MAQYIDKAAVVAEIERLKECNRKICGGNFDFLKKSYPEHYYSTEIYDDILSFINTLEVKEVDLEKEYEEFVVDDPILGNFIINDTMGMVLAKHFFELGMQKSKGEQRYDS